MEKDEILTMAQEDNKNLDLADIEAQKSGAYIGYFVLGIIVIVVTFVDRFVLDSYDFGMLFACFSMLFTAFLVKFIKLKKKHELFCTIVYGCATIACLVFWILQLTKVW